MPYCRRVKGKKYRDCLSCLLSLEIQDEGVKGCIREIIKSSEFKKVVEVASEQNVAQVVYHNLLRLGLVQSVEHKAKDLLEEIYAKRITKNIFLRNELIQTLKILSQQGIQVMLLKGVVSFFEKYYSDVPLRFMQDIDLYIRSEDLERVSRDFHELGYKEYTEEHGFHRIFYKSAGVHYYIELHYLPTSEALMGYFKSVDLWQKATLCETAEAIFYLPSPTHLFYYKLVHDTVLHKHLFRLRYHDLYDGAAMVKFYGNKIQWNELLELTRSNGLDFNLQVYAQAIVSTGLFQGIKEYVPVSKQIEKYVSWIYRNMRRTRSICAKERFIYIHNKSQNIFDFILKSRRILWDTYVLNEDRNVIIALYPKAFKDNRPIVPCIIIEGIHFCRLLILHVIVTVSYWISTIRGD